MFFIRADILSKLTQELFISDSTLQNSQLNEEDQQLLFQEMYRKFFKPETLKDKRNQILLLTSDQTEFKYLIFYELIYSACIQKKLNSIEISKLIQELNNQNYNGLSNLDFSATQIEELSKYKFSFPSDKDFTLVYTITINLDADLDNELCQDRNILKNHITQLNKIIFPSTKKAKQPNIVLSEQLKNIINYLAKYDINLYFKKLLLIIHGKLKRFEIKNTKSRKTGKKSRKCKIRQIKIQISRKKI